MVTFVSEEDPADTVLVFAMHKTKATKSTTKLKKNKSELSCGDDDSDIPKAVLWSNE